jgi:hypothetical protein
MAHAKEEQPDTPALADSSKDREQVKTGNRAAERTYKPDEILGAVKRARSYAQ